jgi:predicted GIY-YIG superfamily endonuclease
MRGSVYVLKLEDNCFYIGFTTNLERRMKEHFEGNGSIWTKLHKPISVIKVYENKTLNFETYLTEKAILKYGYSFVRGGDHIYFSRKYGKNK